MSGSLAVPITAGGIDPMSPWWSGSPRCPVAQTRKVSPVAGSVCVLTGEAAAKPEHIRVARFGPLSEELCYLHKARANTSAARNGGATIHLGEAADGRAGRQRLK